MRSNMLHGCLGALALAACSSPSAAPGEPPSWHGTPSQDLCPPRFADCDGISENGCEAALETSAESCGACGVRCEAALGGDGAAALCVAGACAVVCDAGRADCDGDAGNGCEVHLLEDASHCGACGVTCSAACHHGTCDAAVLAGELPLPTFLRMDESGLYWTNQGSSGAPDGSVMRLDPGGGTAVVLAAEQAQPGPLVLDEATVYFAHRAGIAAVPKGGGEVTELASGVHGVAAMVADRGTLYWVEVGTPPAFEDGGLFALSLGDEPTRVLLATIAGRPSGVALDAGHVYVSAAGGGAADGAVYRVARDGMPPRAAERVVDKLERPRGLRAHAGAFWMVVNKGVASFTPGRPLRRVVSELPQDPAELAFDEARVFWTTAREADGQVQSARLDGSDLETHGRNLDFPWGVAVDGENVYWTSVWAGGPRTGALLRASK
ncbi:hypothetical protein AB3662_40930 [Sorangium cellulosum]|uniref:hypothetical protein n=1 Tax=Sorangium cellulosum TaxID=56 RepID=UPI003D9A7745